MQRSLDSGYLHLALGPMFSGKTTSLISATTRYRDLGCKCLIINHASDKRETTGHNRNITFHSGTSFVIPNDIDVISTDDLNKVVVQGYQCVAVDEIQFFDSLTACVEWVEKHKCHVFVSGLNGSSERKIMGDVANLIPFADEVIIHKACCLHCLKERGILTDAIFTRCKINKDTEVCVGGSDIYEPVCRNCYVNLSK